MAKGIHTGIEKMVKGVKPAVQKQAEQLARQWQEIKNRLDIILVSNNVLKGTALRQKCLALDGMSYEERQQFIQEQWGPLYLQKTMPLLQQLDTLERAITPTNNV
jgi:hypothetical protein